MANFNSTSAQSAGERSERELHMFRVVLTIFMQAVYVESRQHKRVLPSCGEGSPGHDATCMP